MKWAKDQTTFCRSYVFMEKFKIAQNKKSTETAIDMWILRHCKITKYQLHYKYFSSILPKIQEQFSETVYSEKNEHNLMSTMNCQKQLLLVCYTFTFKSLMTQFWHKFPLHLVHIEVHFNPHVKQVHQVVHSILQPHLIIFRSSCGAGDFVICTGRHIPFHISHPHRLGGKSFPHQLWTVW